jgi:hypothetical protein
MSNAKLDPAANYVAVTKSDTTDLGPVVGLYIGGAGDVAVSTSATGANGVVFTAVPVGTQLRVQCRRVMSTGTSATLIVALY